MLDMLLKKTPMDLFEEELPKVNKTQDNLLCIYEKREYSDDVNKIIYRKISYNEFIKLQLGEINVENLLLSCIISFLKNDKVQKMTDGSTLKTFTLLIENKAIDLQWIMDIEQPKEKAIGSDVLTIRKLYDYALTDLSKYQTIYYAYIKTLQYIDAKLLDYIPYSKVKRIVSAIESERASRQITLQTLGIMRTFGAKEEQVEKLIESITSGITEFDNNIDINDLKKYNKELFEQLVEFAKKDKSPQSIMLRKQILENHNER